MNFSEHAQQILAGPRSELSALVDRPAAPAIAQRVRRALIERGVPARKIHTTIAETCGITAQSVGRWFNGKTIQPRATHLARLAITFDIALYWLILGDEVQQSP
jgi:transcriptional regulator with XRE-family HTH domain